MSKSYYVIESQGKVLFLTESIIDNEQKLLTISSEGEEEFLLMADDSEYYLYICDEKYIIDENYYNPLYDEYLQDKKYIEQANLIFIDYKNIELSRTLIYSDEKYEYSLLNRKNNTKYILTRKDYIYIENLINIPSCLKSANINAPY